MSIALISDIHGNLDALEIVLNDIDQRGIETIYCLGDTIGYGPNPCECLDKVMQRCTFTLMGNHDFAALFEPTNFNSAAEQSAYWTRRQLELESDSAIRKKRWEFLGNLKVRHIQDKALCVHASPRRPINEYIFPDDVITAPVKMRQIFSRFDTRCYVGHTHVPGVFTDEPDFYAPQDFDHNTYTWSPHEKCIINPGSVGQPRDQDPRSSYAILDEKGCEFIRLEYDIQSVIDKVHQETDLNDFLGMRLLEGR